MCLSCNRSSFYFSRSSILLLVQVSLYNLELTTMIVIDSLKHIINCSLKKAFFNPKLSQIILSLLIPYHPIFFS